MLFRSVKTCLANSNLPLAATRRRYKITFTACSGAVGSSDYLEIFSNGNKILTTDGGGMITDGALAKLCSSSTPFLYQLPEISPTQRFCIKTRERRTLRDDPQHGTERCLAGVMRTTNTINISIAGGGQRTLTFTMEPL